MIAKQSGLSSRGKLEQPNTRRHPGLGDGAYRRCDPDNTLAQRTQERGSGAERHKIRITLEMQHMSKCLQQKSWLRTVRNVFHKRTDRAASEGTR